MPVTFGLTFLIAASMLVPTDQIWSGVSGYVVPNYFSGTNSRIYATVGNTYDGLQRVEMRIGGDLVWEEDFPSPPYLGTLSAGGGVTFDSTRFPHGESVEVEVKVWGWGPSYRQFSEEIPVINHAVLYGRYDLEISYLNKNSAGDWVTAEGGDEEPYRSLPSSNSHLPGMGYGIEAYVTTLGWTALDFGNASENCNVLHVHTHGNSGFLWSDANDYWYAYVNPPPAPQHSPLNIYSTVTGMPSGSINLLDHRMAANGSQYPLPPFNTTGKPPINLAYFDSCSTGVTNDFAEAVLWPYGNIYTGVSQYPENQSCVGFALSFTVNQTQGVADAFWGYLADTYTVTEARSEAFDAYDAGNKPSAAVDFMHVWGDFYTRLKGVYTGTTGSESRWYL